MRWRGFLGFFFQVVPKAVGCALGVKQVKLACGAVQIQRLPKRLKIGQNIVEFNLISSNCSMAYLSDCFVKPPYYTEKYPCCKEKENKARVGGPF
jgi:hypothetical protein